MERFRFILVIKKNSEKILRSFTSEIKKDISSYNKQTELLAIWTIIFLLISGLFALSLKSNLVLLPLYLFAAIGIMFAGTVSAIYYIHCIKYKKNKLISRIHTILNKSFKIRSFISSIKIPYPVIFNLISKGYRYFIKQNFKLST